MTQPRELIALITRLRKSGQPLKQVRLLLKLWQAVEDVPRRERFRLLRHLGLEGGEQLVAEFLSGGGRLDPKTAATGVRLLDSIPQSRLRAFTSRHLSPEETGEIVEMLRRLLTGQAGDELKNQASPPPAPPPSEEPYIRRSSRREEPPPEEPAAASRREQGNETEGAEGAVRTIASEVIRTAAVGLAGVAAAKAAASKDSKEAVEPDEAEPDATREAEPAPATAKSPEPEPEPAPAVEKPPEPDPTPLTRPPTARPVIVTAPPTRHAAPEVDHRPPAEWLTGLQAQATATSRLRAFTRLEEQLAEVSPADARSLVELFPAGWMRRRVLQRLFSAGLVSSGDATQMVTELEATPVTYLWLAGALLDSADTNADQRQSLIDNAPSATIRRLLEARNRA